MDMLDMGKLAAAVGVTEPAIRLLVGVLSGYPLSLIYRVIAGKLPVVARHAYSLLAGLWLAWFCYGYDLLYSFGAMMVTYVLLSVLPRGAGLVASWIFNLGSLLLAYYYVSTAGNYDIDWTTAQCVLALRMIGFSFDYYDGATPKEKRQTYQKTHALDKLPPLFDFLGFGYSWSGFLVGPQYSFSTYRRFIADEDKVLEHRIPVAATLTSFLIGAAYVGLSTVGGMYAPVSGMLADDFVTAWPLWQRVMYVVVAMRVCLVRYGGIWMLTNGHCILLGIGYQKDSNGKVRWDGLANFLPSRFETALQIDDYVGSFNINTNLWVKEYVFKRLRFLNNKHLSLLGSMVFLAVWHGFAPGYFFNFGMEFLDMLAEGHLRVLLKPFSSFAEKKGGVVKAFWNLLCYLTAFTMLSLGFQAFEMKTLENSLKAYAAIGYIGQIVPLFLVILGIALRPLLRERKPKQAKD